MVVGILVLFVFRVAFIDLNAVLGITELSKPTQTVIGASLLGAVMIGVSVLLGTLKNRTGGATLGFRAPRAHRGVPPMVLAALVLVANLVFGAMFIAFVRRFGMHLLEPPETATLVFQGVWRILSYLTFVIGVPLSEEVFFRGLIFGGLARPLGPVVGGVVSAMIFGGAHAQLGLMIPAMFAGLLFAWLYYRTQSLWVSFAAHAAQNSLVVFASGFGT